MVDFALQDPFLAVHWRWERAGQLLRAPALSRQDDDKWVRRAFLYRRAYESSRSHAARDRVARRYSDVHWAQLIWRQRHRSGVPGHLLASELEARLLAGQSCHDIAQRMGAQHEVVRTYERLFYAVIGRLQHRAYIEHVAIGAGVFRGIPEHNLDLLWKYYGYHYGPYLLDAVIERSNHHVRPEDSFDVTAAMADIGAAGMHRRAMELVDNMKLNDFNGVEFLNAQARLRAAAAGTARGDAGGTGGGAESYAQNVAAMADALQRAFAIGHQGPPPPAYMGAVGQLPGELRSHELLQLASGRELPTPAELQASFAPLPAANSGEVQP